MYQIPEPSGVNAHPHINRAPPQVGEEPPESSLLMVQSPTTEFSILNKGNAVSAPRMSFEEKMRGVLNVIRGWR